MHRRDKLRFILQMQADEEKKIFNWLLYFPTFLLASERRGKAWNKDSNCYQKTTCISHVDTVKLITGLMIS